MRVNIKDFKDGETLYLYFYGPMRDGSGRCNLEITNTQDNAVAHGTYGEKIFKIKLKEISTKKK